MIFLFGFKYSINIIINNEKLSTMLIHQNIFGLKSNTVYMHEGTYSIRTYEIYKIIFDYIYRCHVLVLK